VDGDGRWQDEDGAHDVCGGGARAGIEGVADVHDADGVATAPHNETQVTARPRNLVNLLDWIGSRYAAQFGLRPDQSAQFGGV
jgi:hypothetical protein